MGNRALQPPVFQMKHCSHLLQCATACAKQYNRHDPVRCGSRSEKRQRAIWRTHEDVLEKAERADWHACKMM
ncbi:hypothetical protein CDS [Bradyrhizobium sp.]|nr:hypothetical protein CDS [Bradyrhizobium sp.]